MWSNIKEYNKQKIVFAIISGYGARTDDLLTLHEQPRQKKYSDKRQTKWISILKFLLADFAT